MSHIRALLPSVTRKCFSSPRLTAFLLVIAALAACTGCGMLSQLNPAAQVKTSVTPRVNVTPANPNIASDATEQFTALVQNTSNTAVVWTTSGGTISSTGLFHAPKVTDAQ